MLSEILASQHEQFTSLAEAWLSIGATTFSVWEDEMLLAYWSKQGKPEGATLEAPIQFGAKTLGQLQVTGSFDQEKKTRLQTEANLISQLLKQEDDLDSLTAELVESQDQLLALYSLTQSTRNQLNVEQMLASLVKETIRPVKAEAAFIALEVEAGQILIEQAPAIAADEILVNFSRQVQATGGEELIPIGALPSLALDNIANLFLTPIVIQGQVQAVLGLFLSQSTTVLSPQLKMARAIAEFAGAQIENALLHQQTLKQAQIQTELELAASIQLQLLPQMPPGVPGLDLAAGSKPALQVGGDFYDFIHQMGWPCTLVVGDISGKAMSAALLMAMTRTVIRSKANLLPTPTPDEVLGYANEIMYNDFTEVGMFATAFAGYYSPKMRRLIYANAGHSPVIYCPAGGSAQLLQADGPAMGVLPISLSENQIISFQPNDLLVVATDGFCDARNPNGDMFGYDRLLQLVEEVAMNPSEAIVDSLFDRVSQFSDGCTQDDDQTVLVVKGEAV